MSDGTVTSACAGPGCGGRIVDGYCDRCGLPAPTPNGRPAPDAAARTGASSGLGSSPFGSSRAKGTARQRRATDGHRSARLGAGITVVPPIPVVDAATAVMAVPEVPEHRRVCAMCGHPVGRSRDGRPGRTEGFCPHDGHPFSFSPKLGAGDLVAGQYEVAGCLAFGGLGWVYLAKDRNVSDRWVALKGLLDSGDPDAVQAAIAEREFLARVEHPLIVKIYNFVEHDGAGYIVMEYVGGTSLKDLLKRRREANGGVSDPIPVDQAVAYVLEVLPAFQYLHDEGLLYCDFKPDNVIQAGDSLTLIDLGGVRRDDDLDSPIYGTVGYQAPEVPYVGPSVAADVHTIGRTLVSLMIDFRGNTTTYAKSLPPPQDVPLFERHDSLYRLLLKACAVDPADRFSSCDEMRTQLLGVLREIVARDRRGDRAADHSTPSLLFHPPRAEADTLLWSDLPALRLAEDDPGLVAALGRVAPDAGDDATVDALLAAGPRSVETSLHLCTVALAAGRTGVVRDVCAELLDDDPWEWRAVWCQGLAALRDGQHQAAQEAFNAVYGQVPGEPAPKLALALACEKGGRLEPAEQLYLTCLRTDAHYVTTAALGLSRVRGQAHEEAGRPLADAVAALDLVPATSRSFVVAQHRRAVLLVVHGDGIEALDDALASVAAVTLAPAVAARLRVDALRSALGKVLTGPVAPGARVGGVPAEEQALRAALDTALRDLVALTEDVAERVRLIDEARSVRPWSWT